MGGEYTSISSGVRVRCSASQSVRGAGQCSDGKHNGSRDRRCAQWSPRPTCAGGIGPAPSRATDPSASRPRMGGYGVRAVLSLAAGDRGKALSTPVILTGEGGRRGRPDVSRVQRLHIRVWVLQRGRGVCGDAMCLRSPAYNPPFTATGIAGCQGDCALPARASDERPVCIPGGRTCPRTRGISAGRVRCPRCLLIRRR